MRALHKMSRGTRLVTAAEFEDLPLGDSRHALVEGQLGAMSPVSFAHGRIVIQVGSMLHAHVGSRDLGVVVTEVGFVLATNPDTVRAPDIAFVAADRIPPANARGFFAGPPDLAVEVTSPEDRATATAARVADYLRHGTAVVLVVDPERQTASVHRRLTPTIVAAADGVIDLDDVVPGCRDSVRDVLR